MENVVNVSSVQENDLLDVLHTGVLFCYNPDCDCRESQERHALLNDWYRDGLIGENYRILALTGQII